MSKNLLKLNHDQTDFQGNDDFLFENIKIEISDPFLFSVTLIEVKMAATGSHDILSRNFF